MQYTRKKSGTTKPAQKEVFYHPEFVEVTGRLLHVDYNEEKDKRWARVWLAVGNYTKESLKEAVEKIANNEDPAETHVFIRRATAFNRLAYVLSHMPVFSLVRLTLSRGSFENENGEKQKVYRVVSMTVDNSEPKPTKRDQVYKGRPAESSQRETVSSEVDFL